MLEMSTHATMRYPDSTPTVFSGARRFVEQHGITVWSELCDTVMPDGLFNVTEVAGKLECLRSYRQPERYLRAVLQATLADFAERPLAFDGNPPVSVAPRCLQLQHHLPCRVALHPFVGQRRAGDVAAQLFQRSAIVRRAAHCGVQAETVGVGARLVFGA
jgi:hypothetical protein